jgi:hypothetical protein
MEPSPPKPGTRALGVAESYRGRDDDTSRSILAGAVVRADRVVDGLRFGRCRVGGLDATDAIADVFSSLGREDVRYCLLAGVAPAWFNLVDLDALESAIDRPVVAVSFEPSPGLEPAIREEFDGEARTRRLAVYRRLPPRRSVAVGDRTVYVRAVGVDEATATAVVRAYTPADSNARPEPLRVAAVAARAARAFDETA